MSLLEDMRRRLGRYAAGQLPLADLEGWLMPNLGAINARGGSEAKDLAAMVLGYLSELSDGLMTEEEVRARIQPLIATQVQTVTATLPARYWPSVTLTRSSAVNVPRFMTVAA
jgi:hypothetical protein